MTAGLISMTEILKIVHYPWRDPDGKVRPKTQVTWRDDKDMVYIDVLEGTLRDREKILREVKLHRG